MKRSWIKLYIEILDDPKMGRLSDALWRLAVELFLLAGECGDDGLLPPVDDLAWRLRTNPDSLNGFLRELSKVNIVHETSDGWVVTHFKNRQELSSESAKRVERYRARRVQSGMSVSPSYSSKDILDRDHNQCVYCGSEESLCVDHMIPIVQGGTDDNQNLAAACKKCNSGKAGRTPEQAGYSFLNKDAEERYKTVTVTCHGDSISSSSPSSSDSQERGGVGEKTTNWIPETPKQAASHPDILTYQSVSGRFPGDRDYQKIIETVQFLRDKHPKDLEDYLKPYWIAWSSRKATNGKPYNPASLVWLCEWAMMGEIPQTNGREPQPTTWTPIPGVEATRRMLEEKEKQFTPGPVADQLKGLAGRMSK